MSEHLYTEGLRAHYKTADGENEPGALSHNEVN